MKGVDNTKADKFSLKTAVLLTAASITLGLAGGAVGSAFSHSISLVTDVRADNGWILYFLPLMGVAIVFLYKKLGIASQGTNTVLEAADGKPCLSPLLSVGVFSASVLSHLCGASVGREGAALQIGGSIALPIKKLFKIKDCHLPILARCGIAAVFSAVFGTPLTAFLFVLEVVCVGTLHLKSILFSFISSFTAFGVSQLLNTHVERFNLTFIPNFSFDIIWKILIITLLTSVLSIGFCHLLYHTTKYAKRFIKNAYLRIFLGGALVVGLTALVSTTDYNGAGVNVIERIFDDTLTPNTLNFKPEAFLLKLLFTTVSVAAGYKGGEIVPTLFIGSAFGALTASVIGLPVPFGAALGMILLFCGVTNCPLASLALSFELFSGAGFWYFLPTVAVCFVLSGKISLYSAQKHKFRLL